LRQHAAVSRPRATWWGRQVGRADSLRRERPTARRCRRCGAQGNRLKQQGGGLLEEEDERASRKTRCREPNCSLFPNLTVRPTARRDDRSRHIEVRRWGTPRQGEGLQGATGRSAREAGPDRRERSVRIAQSRFCHPAWARALALERAPDQPDAATCTPGAAREVNAADPGGTAASLMGLGSQLPKFARRSFRCADGRPLADAPPPQVPITRSTADEADRGRTTAASIRRLHPCFPHRREAGTYGRDTAA